MKRLSKCLGILILTLTMTAGLYANGINLNGNGSKAIAMGGAFVGLADDYSAVYWNPAGLTQMKDTTLAFFATNVIPKATYKLAALGIDAENESKMYPSPGIGFFKPLSPNVVVGVYAYVPSGIGSEWDGNDLKVLSGGMAYKWKSQIGIFAFSPAIAVKFTEQISFGLALNLDYGMMKLKRPVPVGQYEEDLKGLSFGATFGLLFKPIDVLSIGLSLKTPMKPSLSGDAKMPGVTAFGLPAQDDAERKVTMPLWFGAGLCFKPLENLTFTLDAQYTNWKKLKNIPITYTHPGWKANFETGSNMVLNWKDALQWRFGAEFWLSHAFALRAGFYTDPIVSPIDTHNILLPEHEYTWVTFGFGFKSPSGNLTLDVAVEYGMGKDITVSFAQAGATGMPGTFGAKILVPNLALTIRL